MLDEALLRDFDVSLSVYNLLDEALLRDFRVGLGLGIVFSEALAFFFPLLNPSARMALRDIDLILCARSALGKA